VSIKKPGIFLVVLALAGCASIPDGATPGKVGIRSVINGIDVWTGGEPARPYRVIVNTGREGADSSVTYRQQEESIAEEASQRGADAVIVLNTIMVVSRMDQVMGRTIMGPKVQAELIKYQ